MSVAHRPRDESRKPSLTSPLRQRTESENEDFRLLRQDSEEERKCATPKSPSTENCESISPRPTPIIAITDYEPQETCSGFLADNQYSAAIKSKLIARYRLDEPVEKLNGYSKSTVLYKKVRMNNGKWLYVYRDTRFAFEQETGYIERAPKKKGGMDTDKYLEKKSRFGLIVFQCKDDLDPLVVYLGYLGRWDIEVMFDMYKNIIDSDTVNVQIDYRLYATELINFISVIITTRIRRLLDKTLMMTKRRRRQPSYTHISKSSPTCQNTRR